MSLDQSSEIASLKKEFALELSQCNQASDVTALQIKYLGRKGILLGEGGLMSRLVALPKEEKKQAGQEINTLRVFFEEQLAKLSEKLLKEEADLAIEKQRIDVTLPGAKLSLGCKHPLNQLREEMLSIFSRMGFSIQYGPDIDSDYYNFEGLNYPEDHPARQMQDTFYISPELLLRTHTSSTQLRLMEKHEPPIRFVTPGTVYRNETISARSHVFFHQIEGIYVDKDVTFADLFATMESFWKALFGSKVKMRFRPSYFPFVEPGLEVDLSCTSCDAKGCRLCKHSGWLEVAGAGMIHPEVLKNGGIDPEVYRGYAWGLGLERIALLRYGIPDLRLFFENDSRFLQQF